MDTSWFHVAHFQEHGVVLEVPAKVEQGYTVLENPSFSPIGVLLRIMPAVGHFIPITSVTLIYYYLNLQDVTLHLYLIPNDWTIQKVTLRTRNVGPGWIDRILENIAIPLEKFSTWNGIQFCKGNPGDYESAVFLAPSQQRFFNCR